MTDKQAQKGELSIMHSEKDGRYGFGVDGELMVSFPAMEFYGLAMSMLDSLEAHGDLPEGFSALSHGNRPKDSLVH
ncbi:MAG: hypothetical protein EOO38_09535 [Cytophagaceae bacterium]|nr:MAG: hypothetical protein EOO38_09535 [Cytophagaceae bacterium]